MKACVVGATGLVGLNIVKILLEREDVSEVRTFVRRLSGLSHPKLHELIVDFEIPENWRDLVNGDVLFSALGTTLKAAGSKSAQYKVDHDYQLEFAKAASQNNVSTFVLISSVNADAHSSFFYLKMKGELENEIKKLNFKSTKILRPGPLKGHRENPRLGETILTGLLDHVPTFLVGPDKKPIEGERVAKVAVKVALEKKSGINYFEAGNIWELSLP